MTYYDYEYSRPIGVKGGIRAASRRGGFGSNWWAKRWMETLEQFSIGARLSRGRSYARRGQVLSIDIQPGVVEAQVQGSRKRPYDVEISVRTIDANDWERLREALAEQPVIAASLLAGRMPENIEDTFKAVGLSMFPERGDDLETDCSCPDWSNPCKHIAAVYLLLGEEFDRDPFLIFRMRGMDRGDLLGEEFRQSAQTIEGPPLEPDPLPEDPDVFWANPLPALASADLGTATAPAMHAALPKQLGRFPFWQGEQDLTAIMEAIYTTASEKAVGVYINQAEQEPDGVQSKSGHVTKDGTAKGPSRKP